MLAILTRDEAFHVPLNVHFIREVMQKRKVSKLRMKAVYHLLFVALVASTVASRRRAKAFDRLSVRTLARAYAEQLAGLFMNEEELDLAPPRWLLLALGIRERDMQGIKSRVAIDVAAAEASADRHLVEVAAL